MAIMNNQLNEIEYKRQLLIKKLDKNEITNTEYNRLMILYSNQAHELRSSLIQKEKKENLEKMEEQVKVEEKSVDVTTEKPKKLGKSVQSNSTASLIGKALESSDVKTLDDVVKYVKELKQEVDEKKVKSQAKTIIGECEKGKGRWAKYVWDKETFLLKKRE